MGGRIAAYRAGCTPMFVKRVTLRSTIYVNAVRRADIRENIRTSHSLLGEPYGAKRVLYGRAREVSASERETRRRRYCIDPAHRDLGDRGSPGSMPIEATVQRETGREETSGTAGRVLG
jgi:hypothetical protein